MRISHNILILSAAAFLVAGCQSNPKPKPSVERGWIGGEYRQARKSLVPKGQQSKVYLKQVYPGTPAEQAGLKPGDLIVAVNEHPVGRLKEFRQLVDASLPGSQAVFHVLRNRESLELPVTVGRETYQQWRSFTIGLAFSTQFDVWPNPDFSLLPLAQYRHPQKRVELRSPEVRLAAQASKAGNRAGTGTYSDEGWNAWFVLFGLSSHKQILRQEPVGR